MRGRLTLTEFRDADLMAKLAAEGGADGMTAREFAEALGFTDDEAAWGVARRATYMRDELSVFEYDKERKLWRISDWGDRVVEANRGKSKIPEVDDAPDESLIDVMAHVTSRARSGDERLARILRREFIYGTTKSGAAYRANGRRR